ncbi:MAG: hypothetical protein J0M02_08135 [Planctomycetes bacterium]|nr:hypothetical protein [Planctomycetota bacterium]
MQHTRPHLPASALAAIIDAAQLSELLRPWLPDAGERAFVVRIISEEGPTHHRCASYALLRLLATIAARTGALPPTSQGLPVAMRLPPHLAGGSPPTFPLALDPEALAAVSGGEAAQSAALADALCDGPAHHVLANVAMANLAAGILRALERR